MAFLYSCRSCPVTSYKQLIQRDDQGRMRACAGCGSVFFDPRA
jgi:hypothetical protein